jgi:methionyl-tRNA synthetase
MRLVMELADRANPYVENAAPWSLRKDPAKSRELQDVGTVALNLFRQLAIYLAPVLPRLAEQTGQLLNQPITHWDDAQRPLVGTPVAVFQHLLQRVEKKDVDAMIEDSKEPDTTTVETGAAANAAGGESVAAGSRWDDSDQPLRDEPLAGEISIDDFAKVDLRIARVIAAEDVPEARKLLKLTLSLGGDHHRTVFAGIKAAYQPEDLVGRLVVMVANLAPRTMKFGVSEGMVTASGSGGDQVFLLGVDHGGRPGQRVH